MSAGPRPRHFDSAGVAAGSSCVAVKPAFRLAAANLGFAAAAAELATDERALIVAIVLSRLLVPLLIPRWPLVIIAALVLDAALMSRWFLAAENFPLGTALFFAFLITLLLWLYDVYKPVYDVRFASSQHRVASPRDLWRRVAAGTA